MNLQATHRKIILAAIVVLWGLLSVQSSSAQSISDLNADALFGGIKARQIGPALMSGRISDIAIHPTNSKRMLVGAAGGGVWYSENGGTVFKSIFDDHAQCIGAVAFDPSSPDNTYWVGTGEQWTRNSVSVGDGIYKTTDGGKSWNKMGLQNSERIANIFVHPENPQIVYVAVLGALWSDSEERGVYKTTDGGKSWKKILYINEKTGCGDLAMDPSNPEILYAGMWEFRRTGWSFESGGNNSSLYKSVDGGDSWSKIHTGFPEGKLGRFAVAIAPSYPDIVYSVVESEDPSRGGLYRSTDGGNTWEHRNSDFGLTLRPFYFSRLTVDPKDPDILIKAGLFGSISRDGGKTFANLGAMHADIHDAVFDPQSSDKIVFGNDGGVNISYDGGLTTVFVDNLPVSQYYHVSVDNQQPYNIYGGLQDNGSWIGPSYADGGIQSKHWECVGFGDGFRVYPHPQNPNIVYSEMQGAEMVWRYDRNTKQTRTITPTQFSGDPELRFNWNASLTTSPNIPDRLYIGSQFVHRSDDMGDNWVKISPDLTSDDPAKYDNDNTGGITRDKSGAENHCTIFTIAESPSDKNVIWAGTDDGLVHVTKDDGKNWIDVTQNIIDLPAHTWCYHIEASTHDPATAYAVFDGHTKGDRKPYVYKTKDHGETWTSIGTENIEGFARSIQEDIYKAGMLYLGTEMGLYISIDDGGSWHKFTNHFPPVAVHYLTMSHTGDLVAATHGRGIIIIDELHPLRQIDDIVVQKDIHFFQNEPFEYQERTTFEGYGGNVTEFVGENPTNKMNIAYYLKKKPLFGKYSLQVLNSNGDLVADLSPTKKKGINIVPWDGKRKAPKLAKAKTFSYYGFTQPRVPAGTYKAVLSDSKRTFEHFFELRYPKGSPFTLEERRIQEKMTDELYDMCEHLAYVVDKLDRTIDWTEEHGSLDPTLQAGILNDLNTLKKTLVVTTGDSYTNAEDPKLRGKLAELYYKVANYYGKPSGDQQKDQAEFRTKIQDAETQLQEVLDSKSFVKLKKKISKTGEKELVLETKEAFLEK